MALFVSRSAARLLLLNYPRRYLPFSAIAKHPNFHHIELRSPKKSLPFDTHEFVVKLEKAGFSQQQAEAISFFSADILKSQIDTIRQATVTKVEEEIFTQQVLGYLSQLERDIVLLRNCDFASIRLEVQNLKTEIAKVRLSIDGVITKFESHMILDINLEKERDENAAHDLQNQIIRLASSLDKKAANLNITFEQYRHDMMKFCAGAIFSCLTILCLAFQASRRR